MTPNSSLTPSFSLTPNSSLTPSSSLTPNSSLTPSFNLTQTDYNSTVADNDIDGDDSEVEAECLEEFLEQQQQAWEDATTTDTEGCLDPTHPIDEQMMCDIKALASRLASKAQQLLGKQYTYT